MNILVQRLKSPICKNLKPDEAINFSSIDQIAYVVLQLTVMAVIQSAPKT